MFECASTSNLLIYCYLFILFFRPLMETDPEEHRLNYERYRTLVMIDASGGQ